MKRETYDMPRMIRANFSRPGGLIDVEYHGDNVRVFQRMPSPASPNLPWIVIGDVTMSLADFNSYVRPVIFLMDGKLVASSGAS